MSNNKIYLAKSNLASGLDVEYVKSNLMRIPNIIVIEYGGGYSPEDCVAMVIVLDAGFNLASVEGECTIGKNVSQAINSFVEESDIDCIWLYTGKGDSDHGDDVEKYTPLFVPLDGHYDAGIEEQTFDSYANITFDEDENGNLLEAVAEALEECYDCWCTKPRHYKPEPKYAIPEVPSLEERKLKNKAIAAKIQETFSASEEYQFKTSGRRRLLFRK